tara:strand:+ start:1283 stop:1498 length:216 start_codon:yes stop_codon:yes gene_type:complete
LAIICIAGESFSKPSFKSDLVSENNATSAPEIKAEQISKTISKTILDINEVLIIREFMNKTVGSGSKTMLV